MQKSFLDCQIDSLKELLDRVENYLYILHFYN